MSQFRTFQLSLRINSLFICTALLLLTAFLGWKVFSIAKTQSLQMKVLIEGDFKAQGLLQKIEGKQESLKSANKKLWITQDPNYAALVAKETEELKRFRGDLLKAITIAHPEFTETDIEDTAATKRRLEKLLSESLEERQKAASGISRHVLFAVAFSIIISLWISDLFFRRLGAPLRMLKDANMQIARGNLGFRIAEPGAAVSELAELSGSFNRMAAKLQELDRTKYEFFSEVSHQIKNPLAALKEGLDLLSSAPRELSGQSREKAIAACSIASRRLEVMIQNLMQHASIERGFKDFKMEYANLADVIQSAMAQLRPLADKRGIQFCFTPKGELDGRISSEGMTHVIENLIMNAIRYGQEKTEVSIEASRIASEKKPPQLVLRVSNLAKVLPTCKPERLFERFYRANTLEQPSGLGLGLYIVKSIVEAHRGTVFAFVNSEEKRFSVRVEIPISEAAV